MFRPRSVVALSLILAAFVPVSTHAQETNSPAEAAEAPPAATAAKSSAAEPQSPRRTLPKSESELFRMLSESNRRIDDLEYAASQWRYVVSVLQQRFQSLQPPTRDIAVVLALTSQDTARPARPPVAHGGHTLSTRFAIVDAPDGEFVEHADIDGRKLTIGLSVEPA